MKKLQKAVFLLLALMLLIMGLLHVFQEKIIFLPEAIDKEYVYQFPFDFEEVNLKTADNQTINALHIKAKNPKGVVLFFHGNKGNLIRWGEITSYFTQFKYDVFVIDYRGYGKSTGVFNEKKMYEDALLSYNYVRKFYKEENIVVYGRSLGTTFATKVASEHDPKHVILEAPFYNLHHAANFKYKIIPQFLLSFKFNSNQIISKIKSPITIFHGTEDETTPIAGSKQLFKLITATKKELVSLQNGTHHNLRDFQKYTTTLKTIFEN